VLKITLFLPWGVIFFWFQFKRYTRSCSMHFHICFIATIHMVFQYTFISLNLWSYFLDDMVIWCLFFYFFLVLGKKLLNNLASLLLRYIFLSIWKMGSLRKAYSAILNFITMHPSTCPLYSLKTCSLKSSSTTIHYTVGALG
jgi:hypothetical protein